MVSMTAAAARARASLPGAAPATKEATSSKGAGERDAETVTGTPWTSSFRAVFGAFLNATPRITRGE